MLSSAVGNDSAGRKGNPARWGSRLGHYENCHNRPPSAALSAEDRAHPGAPAVRVAPRGGRDEYRARRAAATALDTEKKWARACQSAGLAVLRG